MHVKACACLKGLPLVLCLGTLFTPLGAKCLMTMVYSNDMELLYSSFVLTGLLCSCSFLLRKFAMLSCFIKLVHLFYFLLISAHSRYIPTGVLFDLLCAEPERPWNITVHFRGYPGNLLIPCEGEESVKWNFINALKEAAYIINGNCKNIMNMSQSDQAELWLSVLKGRMEVYHGVSSKLKLEVAGDEFSFKLNSSSSKALQGINDSNATAPTRTGRIPVRLYLRSIVEDIDHLEDSHIVDNWDKISYINHPVEANGNCFTLYDAVKALLPELFADKSSIYANQRVEEVGEELRSEEASSSAGPEDTAEISSERAGSLSDNAEIKLVRIQGIEPKMEIPFAWIANNLMNPEHYLHICVYIKIREPINI
ncbi:autophagy protein 5-like isoform X2 [Primulina eburnea]|uniref:autophagy protein 5-like isoform X2 n=1 Tax=Primulina eburnea TaxID=1245227 RepID=UPI003C6CAB59